MRQFRNVDMIARFSQNVVVDKAQMWCNQGLRVFYNVTEDVFTLKRNKYDTFITFLVQKEETTDALIALVNKKLSRIDEKWEATNRIFKALRRMQKEDFEQDKEYRIVALKEFDYYLNADTSIEAVIEIATLMVLDGYEHNCIYVIEN